MIPGSKSATFDIYFEQHLVGDSSILLSYLLVFIDELDAIAPARKDGGEELSQRMVATLLNLMDGNRSDGLLIIAATNRPDSIEPALRQPGRLDREIEIAVPSPRQRLNILNTLLDQMEHSLSDMQVQNLAVDTHGFVDCTVIKRSGCTGEMQESYAVSATSGLISMPVSLEILASCCSNVTVSGISESIENDTNSHGAFVAEEENILKVAFEDF
ncbi:calmodulin-interacting protein 111 isoform X4 [Jatropha curcas]|nr:calmodulin-interacting protein 111 isoform X4 [Jatropha curcas]XP_020540502.1 calmodulin-interacting protein 111 isoform X4 [Jatropha curcas]XP_020540503.1 calmodulin-interacting protein 111 isoform X4 [Jatropha curcas]XP_037491072.1 calmodulin-interacting protein 111 isoform X4 [Jatropha curcas]XP_037491073.1 calmodulin-interacting protein 111 isoform X4 [Jatropha curcas]XP_037491074.1 calmodulin-interacting protein 111 isoform X4 [Jatropha curcas]